RSSWWRRAYAGPPAIVSSRHLGALHRWSLWRGIGPGVGAVAMAGTALFEGAPVAEQLLRQRLDPEARDHLAHLGDEPLRLTGQRRGGVPDPADLDALVHLERHGHDGRVQVVGDDPGGDRVAVQPDHQVEDRGPIADPDVLRGRARGEDLLGEVEGVVGPLVEGEPGQALEDRKSVVYGDGDQ